MWSTSTGPASLPKIGARACAGQGCAVGPSHRSNYDIVSLMGAHSCGLTCNWVSSRGPRRCACARRCVLVMQCRAVGAGGVSARRRTWQSSRVRQTSSAVRRPSRARVVRRTGAGLFSPLPSLFGSSLGSSLAIASTPFPALLLPSSRRGSTPRQEARPNFHSTHSSRRTDLHRVLETTASG